MTYHSKRHTGFTLVELLVVMLIVSMGLSLVGGFSVSSYSKFQIIAESKQLETQIKSMSRRAWLTEQSYQLEFTKNKLNVSSKSGEKKTYVFSYITFPKQSLEVSRFGVTDKRYVNYMVNKKNKRLVL